MFFLTRCTVWLGVVAWQLPWPAVEAPASVKTGVAVVKSVDAKRLVADVGMLCSSDAASCADAGRRLALSAIAGPNPPAKPPGLRTGSGVSKGATDARRAARSLARVEAGQRRAEPPG